MSGSARITASSVWGWSLGSRVGRKDIKPKKFMAAPCDEGLFVTNDIGLKKINMGMMVFLNIVTCGLYAIIWVYRRVPAINKWASGTQGDIRFRPHLMPLAVGILGRDVFKAWKITFNYHSMQGVAADPKIVGLVTLAIFLFSWIGLISYSVAILKIRALFVNKFMEIDFSRVWTFLFGFLYFQYCINEMSDASAQESGTDH